MLTLVIGNKNYSSWSLRPWLYMRHCGITFEERRLLLHTASFARDVAGFDAAGMVPILLDGAIAVWDSLAIIEYVAEYRREAAPWPGERAALGHARSLAAEMHAGFRALRMELPQNLRRRGVPPRKPLSDACTRDVHRIDSTWQRCLQAHGGPFLFGAFSPVDAMFAPVAMRFDSYAIALSDDAQRYVETLRSLPALLELRAAAANEVERHTLYDEV
ncbi:MAG TPA: glutathione S-transferase family protein [Polyangiales bacterium]|nr:glutathione S-transferase family protein [Polyangiales bacterium]